MFAIARHRELLDKLGLASLEQVKAYRGDLVKNHRGRRDIFRINVPEAAGHARVLYLKRILKPYRKDGLKSLLRQGRVESVSRREWENSRALERAGIAVAGLIAYGEECGPLWEKFSFIITESAPGQTMEQFLGACQDRARRRDVFDALARFVRQMHDAGLATPDLFTRHIFVDTENGDPVFCLIDMARLDRRTRLPERLRARDLAALNVTAPLRLASTRERLRFLHQYAGRRDRRLVQRIQRRVTRLLRRRKFQDFHRPPSRIPD